MIDVVGWIGSALVVVSLLQKRMHALRVINLIACAILVGYNWYIHVWPMVGMNLAVAGINLYYLALMIREKKHPKAVQGRPTLDASRPQ